MPVRFTRRPSLAWASAEEAAAPEVGTEVGTVAAVPALIPANVPVTLRRLWLV
jgi:hypothetical protein